METFNWEIDHFGFKNLVNDKMKKLGWTDKELHESEFLAKYMIY